MARFIRLKFVAHLLVICLAGLCYSGLSSATENLKIGVLAYRPKPQTLKQWQPLADELNKALPDYHFEIVPLTFPELEPATASRQVDFVLANASYYVKLHYTTGLSSPLATLAENEAGRSLTVFGGVIFTKATRQDINTLADLKGKKIAIVGTNSLGGYEMQAYELMQAGFNMPDDVRLTETGLPQDNVVNQILNGTADVGFVRTGLLESLAREGRLDKGQLKVINTQNLPDFPAQVSTRLYPEWAFSAMTHVDERIARKVTAELYKLDEKRAVVDAIGIYGFVVPADYTPVVDLLKTLRISPFDLSPKFTWLDIWQRYTWQLLLGLFAISLILFQSARLYLTRHALQRNQSALLAQQQQLQESEFLWKFAIEGSGDGVWDWNVQTDEAHFSKQWKEMLGYGEEDILPSNAEWQQRIHPDDRDYVTAAIQAYLNGESDSYVVEYRRQCKDDSYKWILSRGMAVTHTLDGKPARIIGTHIDITERKHAEESMRLYVQVFTHAREGIMITDAEGIIVDVNLTLTEITGYRQDELVGKNPRMLSSGRHDIFFFAGMWRDLTNQGHWSGEVWNQRKNGEVYAEMKTISAVRDAQGRIQHYVALSSDITPLKEHAQQLEHIAHYDALTNLPNRVLLADRLTQAMIQAQRRGRLLAVAFIDLDGFKLINDKYGHDAGDQLLISVATRMKNTLRDGDTLSRIGGDEFVAVLLDLADVEASIPMLTRLLAAAAEPVTIAGNLLQVSASVGVTFYPQMEDIDADQLQRQADQAMYQAKQAGKNRYYIFDAEQDSSVRTLHESLDRIRRALTDEEFVLHYQPKVNLRTGVVIGAEALIRWQHPDKGLLSPAVFLPVIEDHPLSIEVGEWVICAVLHQMQAWRAVGLDIPVSVNIGARQLQQVDFVERLREIFAKQPDIPPRCLEIELLETSALEDMLQVSQTISRCREMGVEFALDDFGTGYSSLSYLKRLPVSMLKIDQSFVRDMLDDSDDLAILEGIVGLAEAFQRHVIAEGVESVEHATVLLQLGCDLAQGYGIARPMPAEHMPAWVEDWRPEANWAKQAELSHGDIPVLFASAQHRVWINAVAHYLRGEREAPENIDSEECKLGRWMTGDGLVAHGQQASFTLALELHERVHDLVTSLCALKEQGQDAAALAGLDELHQLHEAMAQQVTLTVQMQLAA